MKNSMKFNNILNILKFFLNSSLNGLFKRPFLKNKVNRYTLICIFVLLYIGYFYLNLMEISTLSTNLKNSSSEELILAAKITLSSYVNLVNLIAAILFILMNSTFSLNKNSLFFIKTLPFTSKEISISQKLFQLVVALFLFELFMIIVVGGLKVISMSFGITLLFFLTLHLVFIVDFLMIDFVYKYLLKSKVGMKRIIYSFLFDLILLLFITYYFLILRFKIDFWISEQEITLTHLVYTLFISSICLILFVFFLHNKFESKEVTYIRLNYYKLPLSNVGGRFLWGIAAITRSVHYMYLTGMVIIFTMVESFQVGIKDTMQLLLFLLPMQGMTAIAYADAMIFQRKMFGLYRIKPFQELFQLLVTYSILSLPLLVISMISIKNIDPYVLSICIFSVATTMGLLFPKSESNINETIAAMLTVVSIILLFFLINIDWTLYPILIILNLIQYFILKKEYEVPK